MLHLILIAALVIIGKVLIIYLRKFFKAQDLDSKTIHVAEGRDIPVWKLTRQVIWLIVFFIIIRTLSINNPGFDLESILAIEFFRFEKFHIAIYHIFVLVMVYFGGRISFSLIRIYLGRRMKRLKQVDKGTEYVYFQLIKYALISIASVILLRSMGVDLNVFMQGILFLSVAVGLGLQDIFKDFFAGFLLLFEGSVKVGDIIEIDQIKPGEENYIAKILQINMRTSKVETRDGKILIIPNSHLTSQKVNNWSADDPYKRFMIPVSVKFGEDLDLVKKILIECARNHPMVSSKKDIIVRLLHFGKDGYELDVVFWANKNFFIEIHKSDIRFAIDHEFRKHGIEFPFGQLDVHMIQEDGKNSNRNDSTQD